MIAFFRNENGQGVVEYALIIGIIAIAVLTVALIVIGTSSKNKFNKVAYEVSVAGS